MDQIVDTINEITHKVKKIEKSLNDILCLKNQITRIPFQQDKLEKYYAQYTSLLNEYITKMLKINNIMIQTMEVDYFNIKKDLNNKFDDAMNQLMSINKNDK